MGVEKILTSGEIQAFTDVLGELSQKYHDMSWKDIQGTYKEAVEETKGGGYSV